MVGVPHIDSSNHELSPMSIRPIALDDLEHLVDILDEHSRSEEHGPIDREGVRSLLRAYVDSSEREALVVESDDRIAGYIAVHWIPFPLMGGVEGYISDLVIAIGARGKGLGSALLNEAESHARSRGCRRLMLNNRVDSEGYKRGFYAKQGFRQREEFAGFVKPLITPPPFQGDSPCLQGE
jgi:ribosomal protein S18 acetylase RimI-like enzyme